MSRRWCTTRVVTVTCTALPGGWAVQRATRSWVPTASRARWTTPPTPLYPGGSGRAVGTPWSPPALVSALFLSCSCAPSPFLLTVRLIVRETARPQRYSALGIYIYIYTLFFGYWLFWGELGGSIYICIWPKSWDKATCWFDCLLSLFFLYIYIYIYIYNWLFAFLVLLIYIYIYMRRTTQFYFRNLYGNFLGVFFPVFFGISIIISYWSRSNMSQLEVLFTKYISTLVSLSWRWRCLRTCPLQKTKLIALIFGLSKTVIIKQCGNHPTTSNQVVFLQKVHFDLYRN